MLKFVIYGARRRLGLLFGEFVLDLAEALSRQGRDADVVLHGLVGLIQAGDRGIAAAKSVLDFARAQGWTSEAAEGVSVPAGAVRLHAPWPGRRIACVGGNYAEHSAGMMPGGRDKPLAQIAAGMRAQGHWGFWKTLHEVAGPDDEIPFPARAEYLDYEGEVAVVIGHQGKDISAARADGHIWGVTLLNDWSIRDGGEPTRFASYNLAKNFDRSASLGPCIVTGLDPGDLLVETRVNERLRQRYSSRDMVFGFGEVLEWLSRDLTFVPGDIIAGGTGAGTAADTSPPGADGKRPREKFLNRGDVVDVYSPEIGHLRNTVVDRLSRAEHGPGLAEIG
jgi:2-keto-4-pentenoate hydratase/2-oxohepta-3-ene-1,7-dioic acid hydratase in catechol pathway